MCHAILRVKYIGEKAATLIQVDSERDLQAKQEDLRGKDQVIEVQVFPRHHDIVLTKTWETKMYTPPLEANPQGSAATTGANN